MDIQIEHWPIGRLIPRVNNPHTHSCQQVAQIAASIPEFAGRTRFWWMREIKFSRGTRELEALPDADYNLDLIGFDDIELWEEKKPAANRIHPISNG
jgi:hypothetical protein